MSEILVCRGLSKRYGGTLALDNVDLSIESGRIVGLLGPNGSGKTTLIKLANGLLQPSRGELRIGGMAPCAGTKSLVSYLPDTDYLPDYMSLGALVKLFADFYGDFDREKAIKMLRELDLREGSRLKALSKGNREKTQLVLAMSRRARLYLLDEPIGGVDPAARDYILRTIIGSYAEDAAVVISTHLIADVEPVLDDVVFLKQGGILLHQGAESLRDEKGMSVDAYFREVFAC